MSIGISLIFVPQKIAQQNKMLAHFGRFIAKELFKNFYKSSQTVSNILRTLTLAQYYRYIESTDVFSSSFDVIVSWERFNIQSTKKLSIFGNLMRKLLAQS